jgi:hypothetical protein
MDADMHRIYSWMLLQLDLSKEVTTMWIFQVMIMGLLFWIVFLLVGIKDILEDIEEK